MGNILKEANQIINERSEEKERQYGPFSEGMKRAAMIASGMSGKEWSAHDMYIAMVALKFSRQSYNFKEDNLLDAVAYIGAWQNFIDEESQELESDTEDRLFDDSDLDVENTVPSASSRNVASYNAHGKTKTMNDFQHSRSKIITEFKAK